MQHGNVRRNAADADVVLRCADRPSNVGAVPARRIVTPVALVVWIHVASVKITCGVRVLNHVDTPTLWCVGDQVRVIGAAGIENCDDDAFTCCVAPCWRNICGALFSCCWYVHVPLLGVPRISWINSWEDLNVGDDADHARGLLPCGECRLCILARSQLDLARLAVVAHRGADGGVVGEANGE